MLRENQAGTCLTLRWMNTRNILLPVPICVKSGRGAMIGRLEYFKVN